MRTLIRIRIRVLLFIYRHFTNFYLLKLAYQLVEVRCLADSLQRLDDKDFIKWIENRGHNHD